MPRQREPAVFLEIGQHLRGDEAMLGEKLTGALAALAHERGALRIEEHHRLGRERAALGGAEGEDIDA